MRFNRIVYDPQYGVNNYCVLCTGKAKKALHLGGISIVYGIVYSK